MIIIITGTPGTGKTTLAKKIARNFHYTPVGVTALIKKKKLAESYDKKRCCPVVDAVKLEKALQQYIEECRHRALQQKREVRLVIDSHMAHVLGPAYVDLCIVTRCDLKVLLSRLHKKKYSRQKIADNMESEIMEVCLSEAVDNGHDPLIIDTTTKVSFRLIKKALAKKA